MIDVIFSFDLLDKEENKIDSYGKEQKNKFFQMKFTLMNFVKEADLLNLKENNLLLFNLITEKLLIMQVITLRVIKYLTASLIFYQKIIQNKNLENSSKLYLFYKSF